jgi:vacuolar-type H+-ATPase subunit H
MAVLMICRIKKQSEQEVQQLIKEAEKEAAQKVQDADKKLKDATKECDRLRKDTDHFLKDANRKAKAREVEIEGKSRRLEMLAKDLDIREQTVAQKEVAVQVSRLQRTTAQAYV